MKKTLLALSILVAAELWAMQILLSQQSDLNTILIAAKQLRIYKTQLDRNRKNRDIATEVPSPSRKNAIRRTIRVSTKSEIEAARRDEIFRKSAQFAIVKENEIKESIEVRYSQFFRIAKLTGAQAEEIRRLLLAREMLPEDINITLETLEHRNVDSGQLARETAAARNAEIVTALSASLGSDGYAQLEKYEAHLPQHALVLELGQAVASKYLPLSEEQVDRLTDILLSVKVSDDLRGTTASPVLIGEPSHVINGGYHLNFYGETSVHVASNGLCSSWYPITDEFVNGASTILSPNQLIDLKQIQAQQAAERQMAKLLGFR